MSETLLSLQGVGKGYRCGEIWRSVFEDVSLAVAAGEVVAVDAERRQGKTTLLRVAVGIESPDSGAVYFAGEDLAELSARVRAGLLGSQIAWVDRRGPRIPWRVIDYVSLPSAVGGAKGRREPSVRRGERWSRQILDHLYSPVAGGRGLRGARERGFAALERVGASRCAPLRWEELADWEQVLVGLARAYAQRPRLIVADDLFDDLRVLTAQRAEDLVRSLVAELDCGVLVSNSEAALFADRILSLHRGTLSLRSDQSSHGEGQLISFPGRLGAGTGR